MLFRSRARPKAEVPGYGTVGYDLAYGGNFYAVLPLAEFGLPFERERKDDILAAGLALMDVINAEPPVHPEDPSIRGCHAWMLSILVRCTHKERCGRIERAG